MPKQDQDIVDQTARVCAQIFLRFKQAEEDAEKAMEISTKIISYARLGVGSPPSEDDLDVFERALGAEHASTIVRSARARACVRAGNPASNTDLAVLLGRTRQGLHAKYGAMIDPATAQELIRAHDAAAGRATAPTLRIVRNQSTGVK